ncbi:RHS repeat-associated core domain-containing protein [Morganella morganii]|uniref:RHS repeat-associated core domain-containing protein n=1 Tax=Morganella morganii TaxID=582 RepID=UPI0034E41B87
MNKTENTLYKKTPSVTVLNNRGLAVRDIVYHRHPDTPEKTDERITRHQFDTRGFLQQSTDPRLQASGQRNFRYITSLSGQVLRTESADAGTSLALNDAAGRPVIGISQIRTDNGQDDRSRAVTQTFQYEGTDSAGRPLSISEQLAGQNAQVTERFVYAGNSEAEKAKNLAGVCTHHYDPAGLMQTDSIALTGVPLSVTRRLLQDADNPDIAVNWPESNPGSLLSAEKYITQTTADATGAVLNTTDAAGHQQKVTYDIAGLLNTSRVTVKGGAEKIIIKSVAYSAAGQKLREEHGNGVVTTYTYEPQTQRLIAVKTEHPARKNVFQDLRYEYDPVGNVLCVTNSAEETRFWHNQKVVPENRYTYDTLYQLVSATGREMANAGQQSGSLPDISPFDKASYTNYTRNYIYDRAGNMTQIRHSAPATNNNYTTDITVSQRSNRAVLKTLADTPEKAEALFTPGGQQTQLQPGQTLSWTTRGELQQVMPVVRDGAAGDRESYRYDADSQRILKTAVQKTGNSTQIQQVIYLPGLELHSGKESYQVICAGVAGRAKVRLLHWPDGKKDHQRFSYDNLIGSSGLETDGDGKLLSQEEYYPFGGTSVLVADADSGIDYKTHRYSGKERDATGMYYYGYRYYQPWAGRWLSSDPAGTVDGLNLFRMVRNNPVTLRDDDGRKPISENFSEEKGDMVYGLAGFRGKYISSALGRPFLPDSKDAPASIIDLYNNTVSGQVLMSVDMKILQSFMKSPGKYEKKLSPPADIKDRVQKSRAYPLWDSYFSAGEKNEKFNIHSVYKEVRKNPGSTQYHEWHMSGAQSAPKLLWKRGSKLGIEIAASGGGNKIHFALDSLNTEEIISKSGMGGQSITASELRYAYRNRERLGANIHFYKDDNEVDAPWVSNPEQWNTYKPKSLSAAGGQLVRQHTGFTARIRASLSRTFRRN